ncbi:MAG TPA: tRNA guanosine(34) transglycosylase Tgt [Chloroflexia bacterium]|nr:tRNA guanosine(34) transglycosylase Tgt [Chloroflexia bacterium]
MSEQNHKRHFGFEVEKTLDTPVGVARAGRLRTPHGDIATPVFMPVGTQATVKSVSPDELKDLKAQVILSNTYHLYLRPGAELVAEFGGLHRFMGWDRPVLTDSGGFQVFSLSHNNKIDDDGVTFKSHLDGSTHRFTPEMVMQVEEQLGADIIMVLDECTPYPSSHDYNRKALQRTHSWAERCLRAHSRPDQALYGIVQGSTYLDLRKESARTLAELDFPGYAVGGLSVGEPKEEMHAMLEETVPLLPSNKPRYLMGVGSPEDLVECVARGIDMFDCVLPTRVARNGALLTKDGRLAIKSPRYAQLQGPVEPDCDCYTCRNFSLGYLHHLFRAKELLAYRLNSIHNLRFLTRMAEDMRAAILAGTFNDYREEFLARYRTSDRELAVKQRELWLQSHGRTVTRGARTRG